MIELTKSVSDRVKNYLTNHPHLRDSDRRLITRMWKDEAKELAPHSMDHTSIFLGLLADGKLTNPESIRRERQILQAKYPELRGKTYRGRQSKQDRIKEEVRELQKTA